LFSFQQEASLPGRKVLLICTLYL